MVIRGYVRPREFNITYRIVFLHLTHGALAVLHIEYFSSDDNHLVKRFISFKLNTLRITLQSLFFGRIMLIMYKTILQN